MDFHESRGPAQPGPARRGLTREETHGVRDIAKRRHADAPGNPRQIQDLDGKMGRNWLEVRCDDVDIDDIAGNRWKLGGMLLRIFDNSVCNVKNIHQHTAAVEELLGFQKCAMQTANIKALDK